VKKCLILLGASLLVAASARASALYNFSVNSTSESTVTGFSLTCSGMPSSCAGVQASQVSVTSSPGAGATLSSLVVGSTLDVATFTDNSGEYWTFDLDTTAITGMGTFNFSSSSSVTEGSSSLLVVSGSLTVSKTTAMPEPMTLWSLLLVLLPTLFVCWRQGCVAPPRSHAL
jgi:hypothetical protein